ncbi:Rhomboid-related protein 4 [Channa argus]|uniref:Rhomboid-related protein 4 n=1 Tax=Channa argus TaxID=215402 RepID=A0A6G1PSR4_CHAAH|nr:Rhomboid-related protein 4 [Channa argus]
MQRGFQLGLLLLVVQLFQEGLGNIPAVTLAVLGFNVYLYVFPAAPLMKLKYYFSNLQVPQSCTLLVKYEACVSLQLVHRNKEWRRLFLSPLHHVNDWHLYFNMVSFLWKGLRLERHLGAAWFLYLLSVFSLLTGLVYLLLQALMVKLIEDKDALGDFIDLPALSSECAVGFSGVLFALKVVSNHYNPGGVTYILNICVSNRFASWVELVLIYLVTPGTSLVGHLAGILVGLLYTVGPLKIIMKTCAGLTEEEQVELAIRKSLNDKRGQTFTTRPRHIFHHADEELSPEELLRRRRIRRFGPEVSNQRRRR